MSAATGAAQQSGAPAHVLDNPVWAAMTGPQAAMAERLGAAARFHVDVSPFTGLADPADPQCWRDLAMLAGPGAMAAFAGLKEVPEGWEVLGSGEGVQMIDSDLRAEPDPEAVALGAADVPEMLDLVSRAQPGPFLSRTVELGSYVGIRRRGILVAMAGERLHPPGWTEISAVCTDSAYRGHGLATRLVRAVAHGIRERGETPFLHAAARNTNAIRLYESIGFTLRKRPQFTFVRVPSRPLTSDWTGR